MSTPYFQPIVRICEFQDCDAGDESSLSAPPMVSSKRFPGKFRLSFLSSTNNKDMTLRLVPLDEGDQQNGLSDGLFFSNEQQQMVNNNKISSSFHFAPNDYEQMAITEKSIAFRHNSTPSFDNGSGNGAPSLHSFVICFNTGKELGTFRTNLDAFHRRAIAEDGTNKTLSATKNGNDNSNGSKKRKCGGGAFGDDKQQQQQLHSSEFDSRTEEGSAVQYFQFYGSLFQQQNMLQDFTRTATYQRAIFENWHDFRGKVVLDVGAGTGILSFFAAQVGAKRVYAVEASSMAAHCKDLVKANGLSSVIVVLSAKIEEVELPEQVDVIVSEPMGYMLVNERMLESYMYARKFLRPGGRMFPARADLHLALFTDDALYAEQQQRAAFWAQQTFHGVALGVLQEPALDELFRQPVVDSWTGAILASQSVKWTVDFERDPVERLHRILIPFSMNAQRTCHVHGIASWFDVAFEGTNGRTIWLSTAPTEPLTHWYQVRCLIKRPMLVLAGQDVRGVLEMVANDKQSYDMELELYTEVENSKSDDGGCGSGEQQQHHQRNMLDLKMPYFRYTGQPAVGPPGAQTECPSDQLNQAVNNYFMGGGGGAVDGAGVTAAAGCLLGIDQQQQDQQQQHHNHQQQMLAIKRQQQQQHQIDACQADADQPAQNGFDNTVLLPPVTAFTAGRSTTRMDDDHQQHHHHRRRRQQQNNNSDDI